MEEYEHARKDLQQARDIEIISDTGDLQELVDYFYAGEPCFLHDDRNHWTECAVCQKTYPDALARIETIHNAVRERVLQRIEGLYKQFVEEFPDSASAVNDSRWYADRIAALTSTYSVSIIWRLYFLLPEHYWKNFSVLPSPLDSAKVRPVSDCGRILTSLSPDALHFLFLVVLATEVHQALYDKLWRMSIPVFFGGAKPGGGLETYDNPDGLVPWAETIE